MIVNFISVAPDTQRSETHASAFNSYLTCVPSGLSYEKLVKVTGFRLAVTLTYCSLGHRLLVVRLSVLPTSYA